MKKKTGIAIAVIVVAAGAGAGASGALGSPATGAAKAGPPMKTEGGGIATSG